MPLISVYANIIAIGLQTVDVRERGSTFVSEDIDGEGDSCPGMLPVITTCVEILEGVCMVTV